MRNILQFSPPTKWGRTNEPEIPETHHRPSAHLSLLPLSDRSRGRATSLPIHSDPSSLSGSIWWPSSVAPAPFLLWLFDSSRVEEAAWEEDGGVRSSDTRSGITCFWNSSRAWNCDGPHLMSVSLWGVFNRHQILWCRVQ
ncbi:unnamed protein product [Musa hybrid cultivar]